jgi:WhiB family redox-sensing transcriptional regulator
VTVVGLIGSIAAQESWIEGALCAQVDVGDLFFPEAGASTRDARAICAACPVRAACLEYALERNEQNGIWGGLTLRQRRQLQERPPKVERTTCIRDHELEVVGVRADGSCNKCRRDRQRRYWNRKTA